MGEMHKIFLMLLVYDFLFERNLLTKASKDVSMSTVDMENLLHTEKLLIENMERYAEVLEKKVNILKKNIFRMKEENEKAFKNTEEYLSNPLAAFSLIRRSENDWHQWELFMKRETGKEFIEEISKLGSSLPNSEDLNEAARGINRIQETYKLSPDDMTLGILNGIQYNSTLSTVDCFAIGFELFKIEKNYPASLWFNTSLTHYQNDEFHEILGFEVTNVWNFYALSNMELGNFYDALKIVYQGLNIFPQNTELIRLKKHLEMKINQEKVFQITPKISLKHQNLEEYERGCRGDYLPSESKNLICRYNKTTTPFLKLAPLKMEEIHTDPYMVLFHDVISEMEIIALKEYAKPKLIRAKVYNEEKKTGVATESRTGKIAWLYDNENEVTDRINQRISDMTGFDLKGSEELQVSNYGLGGHYVTHYDSFNVSMDDPIVKLNGDRIATVMFYQGGATVFPNIQKMIKPQKGSALLWYNLNNRGELNYKTLHAACPVLAGSKWVCNKWIREKAQAFIKPCY